MNDEVKTGEHDPAAEDQTQGEQTVPISVMQAIREELRETKENLNLYRAQLMSQTQQQAPPKSPLDDIADDDVLTGADLKKAIAVIVGPLNQKISEVAVQGSKPDMQKVISHHLPKVLKEKPHLANALAAIQDPAQKLVAAYEFGIMDPDYKGKAVESGFAQQVEKAKQNANKPGSLGTVKGQGAASSEERYASMSDEEIEARYQKIVFGKK